MKNQEVPIDDEDLILEYLAHQKELNPDGPDYEGFVLRYRAYEDAGAPVDMDMLVGWAHEFKTPIPDIFGKKKIRTPRGYFK